MINGGNVEERTAEPKTLINTDFVVGETKDQCLKAQKVFDWGDEVIHDDIVKAVKNDTELLLDLGFKIM